MSSRGAPDGPACGLQAVGTPRGRTSPGGRTPRTPAGAGSRAGRRLEQPHRHVRGLGPVPVLGQPEDGEGRVVGPDGAEVVPDRVVSGLAGGERRIPHPEYSRSPRRSSTTRPTRSSATIPLQSRCPRLDVRAVDRLFVTIQGEQSSPGPPSQKSRLNRAFGRRPPRRGGRRAPGRPRHHGRGGRPAAWRVDVSLSSQVAQREGRAIRPSADWIDLVESRRRWFGRPLVVASGTRHSRRHRGHRTRRSSGARRGPAPRGRGRRRRVPVQRSYSSSSTSQSCVASAAP